MSKRTHGLLILLLLALALALANSGVPASRYGYRVLGYRKQVEPASFRAGAVLVKFKAKADETLASAAVSSAQATEEGRIRATGYRRVRVPAGRELQKIQELRTNPLVEYAGLDYQVSVAWAPNDPGYPQQWGLPKISAPAAWDVAQGDGVTVAVIDTGIDLNHPDLQANIVQGYDFVNNDSSAADDNGHGTHVAGIVAGAGNNGAGGLGIAPRARIMPLKVLDSNGSGSYFDVEQAIEYAADHGAQVISMSLGGRSSTADLQAAVDYAWNKGALVVAAAGNDNSSAPSYPGGNNHVMAVAATNSSDGRASFSNYGSFVSVAAPGVSILSTLPTYHVSVNSKGYSLNYATMSGTSMATPFVSGLAALVISAGTCPGISNAGVRQAIESFADNIDASNPSYIGQLGHGRINAWRSLPSPQSINVGAQNLYFLAQSGNTGVQKRTIPISTGSCAAPWHAELRAISQQASWLSFSLNQAPINTLNVSVDPTGLSAGNYNATVDISYMTGGDSPNRSISVRLAVVPHVYTQQIPAVSRGN